MPISDKLKALVLAVARQNKICEERRLAVFRAEEERRKSEDDRKQVVTALLNEARVELRGESPKDAKARPTVAAGSLCRLLVIDGKGYLLNLEEAVPPDSVLHEYEVNVERGK